MMIVDTFLKTESLAGQAAGLARDYLYIDDRAEGRRDAVDEQLHFFPSLELCREQLPPAVDCDAGRLAEASRKSSSRRAFRPAFTPTDWRTFASFCIAHRLAAGERVLIPGCADRSLRFVVEGSLWHEPAAGAPASMPTNVLGPGCIAGEDTLFCDGAVAQDVRALEDSLVFELTWPRKNELMAAHPEIAFALLRAAGAVIAERRVAARGRGEFAVN